MVLQVSESRDLRLPPSLILCFLDTASILRLVVVKFYNYNLLKPYPLSTVTLALFYHIFSGFISVGARYELMGSSNPYSSISFSTQITNLFVHVRDCFPVLMRSHLHQLLRPQFQHERLHSPLPATLLLCCIPICTL